MVELHVLGGGKCDFFVPCGFVVILDTRAHTSITVSELLRCHRVWLIALIKRIMYPLFLINRSTQMLRTPDPWTLEQCEHHPRVLEGTKAVTSLCIVKVLTVQVVLCIPTAVEALTAILWHGCAESLTRPFALKYRLCAKVHLVQIVK